MKTLLFTDARTHKATLHKF